MTLTTQQRIEVNLLRNRLLNESTERIRDDQKRAVRITDTAYSAATLIPILDGLLRSSYEQPNVTTSGGVEQPCPRIPSVREPEAVFKVGETVAFTFEASGKSFTKEGIVMSVVPAGVDPQFYKHGAKQGCPRDHISYLVRIKGTLRLYWPLTKDLKKPICPSS